MNIFKEIILLNININSVLKNQILIYLKLCEIDKNIKSQNKKDYLNND